MTAATPERDTRAETLARIAYETAVRVMLDGNADPGRMPDDGPDFAWDAIGSLERDSWEAAAAAVAAHVANPAAVGEIRHSGYAGPAAHTFTTRCDGFHPIGEQCNLAAEPRPAPELAAAMAETRGYRERLDAIRELCEARLRVVGMVDGKGVARKVIAIIDKPAEP